MPSHPAALTHSAQSLSPSAFPLIHTPLVPLFSSSPPASPRRHRRPLLAVIADGSACVDACDAAALDVERRRSSGAGLSSSPHHINWRPYPRHRPPPQPRSRSGGGLETLARELREEEVHPWIHETRATPWKGHQQQQLWSGLIPGHGHGHGGLPWKVLFNKTGASEIASIYDTIK